MLLLDPDIEQQLFAEMGNGEVDRQRQRAPDYPQRHWTTKGGRRHVVLTWLIGSGHAPMWRGCPPSRGGAGAPCADRLLLGSAHGGGCSVRMAGQTAAVVPSPP
ncbi:hypothetical protein IU510_10450 [Nocardia cyriacigeorgica]|uniref:hypothetical protein n=1 Tax=Nocardia cyriacigeorgica TaxID=135487 RepID=UPI0018959DF6|nr:hypothetical protein [Nocardia cyriacigeorgica]MBF6098497.1 hypothetical protein [Nocardia cyriacigeorgica]